MSFSTDSTHIFEQAIADYHKTDNVDATLVNPFSPDSINGILYVKNWIDTVQWHLEDIVRQPDINPIEGLAIKRRIDKSNQDRTDLVEAIDSIFSINTKTLLHKPMRPSTLSLQHGPLTVFPSSL